MRLIVLRNFIFFLFGAILASLVYMQIIRGEYYHEQSVNNRIRVVPAQAPRGRIVDRNGITLADNRASFDVAVIPQDMDDQHALFIFLGNVLNKDPVAVQRLFMRRRQSPFDPVVVAQDVDRRTLIAIEENKFQYSGLVTLQSFERYYLFHEAGAHVLGYVGKVDPAELDMFEEYGLTPLSLVGKSGVEKYYDNKLQGTVGGKQIEVNSRGKEVRLLGIKDPIKGNDITLTVDVRVQTDAAQLLGNARGAIVVMDLKNGDLLSMVSSPAFDPNVFEDRTLQDKIANYMNAPVAAMLNRAISGQFPPGSVFKVPVALAAIERHKITPTTSFDCPGFYMLGGARFKCAHVHGREDLLQAMAHSCNVYFYHVGQMVTAPIIGAYAKAFGLGRMTGVDLPSEAKGKIVFPGKNASGWRTGNTLNLAIGQGDTMVTPIQLTVLMAAVAHKGIIFKPRIIRSINGETVQGPDLSKRPKIRLREDTWSIIQTGLRLTVQDEEGTAHLLSSLKDMNIWGKTGTAQSGKAEDHAWFVGFVRSPKNDLAFCVFLEHGGASANAVVITRDLLERMQLLGVI